MTLNRWLPDPPDLGRFRFRPGGRSPGGVAHLPGERFRIAFFAPGSTLPEGWEWGQPPKPDAEEWAAWARATHRRLRAEREG